MFSCLSFSPTTTFLFLTCFSSGIYFHCNAPKKIMMNLHFEDLILSKFSPRTVQSLNHWLVFCSLPTWFFFGGDLDENFHNGLF
jgi:hypothetical protein